MFRHKKTAITILCSFAYIAQISSAGFGQEDLGKEAKIQALKDLCTLSIFLSGHYGQARGWTLINNLLIPKNYPEHSQPRYSFLDEAHGLSKINLGHYYVEALHDFFDQVASNRGVGRYNARLCELSKVVTPRWIQLNIDNPSWDHIFPALKENLGEITKKPLKSIKGQIEDAINYYDARAIALNYEIIHKLSSRGPNLVEKYFADDLFDPELEELDFEGGMNKLQAIKHKAKNPLHWHTDYWTGITTPTSINIFRWYTAPRRELKKIYINALKHIKKGSFQQWWEHVRHPQSI